METILKLTRATWAEVLESGETYRLNAGRTVVLIDEDQDHDRVIVNASGVICIVNAEDVKEAR